MGANQGDGWVRKHLQHIFTSPQPKRSRMWNSSIRIPVSNQGETAVETVESQGARGLASLLFAAEKQILPQTRWEEPTLTSTHTSVAHTCLQSVCVCFSLSLSHTYYILIHIKNCGSVIFSSRFW